MDGITAAPPTEQPKAIAVATKMEPEIAAAIILVMSEITQLGKDGRNDFNNYDYVTVDKFMAIIRPLLAKHGLFFMMEEEETEVYTHQNKQWLRVNFQVTIYHQSGKFYGPLSREVVTLAGGAQAFAAAQSYILKYFLRSVFMIPTGDKDLDNEDSENTGVGREERRGRAEGNRRQAAREDRGRGSNRDRGSERDDRDSRTGDRQARGEDRRGDSGDYHGQDEARPDPRGDDRRDDRRDDRDSRDDRDKRKRDQAQADFLRLKKEIHDALDHASVDAIERDNADAIKAIKDVSGTSYDKLIGWLKQRHEDITNGVTNPGAQP